MAKKSVVASSGRHHCSQTVEISLLFFLLVKFLKQDLEQRLKTAGVHIGALSFGILYLLKNQEQTVGALSQKLTLAPATLVPAVNNLEKKGLIERRSNPRDRRSHRLLITPKGLKLLAGLPFSPHNDTLISQLEFLSSADQKKLHQLLKKLSQAVIGVSKLNSILNLCLKNQ
jgi:DNA-binding MarR family transcriptional regulator